MKDQGLYLSEFERDNCGAGFICNLKGQKSNQIIHDALEILSINFILSSDVWGVIKNISRRLYSSRIVL